MTEQLGHLSVIRVQPIFRVNVTCYFLLHLRIACLIAQFDDLLLLCGFHVPVMSLTHTLKALLETLILFCGHSCEDKVTVFLALAFNPLCN